MPRKPIRSRDIRHNNWVVLVADILISVAASAFAMLFVRWQGMPVPDFQLYVLFWVMISLVCSTISFLIFGTYKIVIRHSTFRSIGKLIEASFVKEVLMSVALLLNFWDFSKFASSTILIATDLGATLIMLIIMRLVVIRLMENMDSSIEKDLERLNIMVFGTSDKSIAMVTRFDQSKHYNVVGFLTRDRNLSGQVIQDHKVYWLGDDISSLKVNLGIEGILFAREEDSEAEAEGLVKQCLHEGIHILTTPKVEAVNYTGLSQKTIKHMVDSEFIPDGMSNFERTVKRVVDCLLAGLLLIVFSPLFLICFIALKVTDKGPVIYKQERIGRFGRPFYIYKFRSMRLDAETDGPALYSGDDDPRLTKVGGFLRKHHLDELPQLWNVFIGDMAFVGYRPERKYYIDQIIEVDPRYAYLYQIRPGVTSYATLKNGYTDSLDKMLRRLEFDLYYLRHRSWWFDIKILFSTFMNIVFGKVF